ncbi:hypothetical protein ACIRL0_01190 [Streptomyces sp. NPDC102365]|uniref:hypothetical protein n=1 Tax=Streptomyces sp. NPDC102365 TaxID=3366162 RepID=UPI00380DB152
MADLFAGLLEGVSGAVAETTSFEGSHVLELPVPDGAWLRDFGVTYRLERRAEVAAGQFRLALQGGTAMSLSCQVSTEDRRSIAQLSWMTGTVVTTDVEQLTRFGGRILHVSVSIAGVDAVSFHLDMGAALENALSGWQLAFFCGTMPMPASAENEQWPRGINRRLFVVGHEDPVTRRITPSCRTMPPLLSSARIKQAFLDLRDLGVRTPGVFPLLEVPTDAASVGAFREALGGIDMDGVISEMHQGRQLTATRTGSGAYTFRFVPDARYTGPRLLLVETYRLTSVPLRYGPGRVIKTFTLLPGERTTMRVSTYKRSSQSIQSTSSVLDSTSDESEREFEQSVTAEQSDQSQSAKSFEYNAQASASAKGSWGWGSASASVSGGVAGSNTSARQEFAKNLTSAVGKNASRASARREVSVDTSMDLKLEEGEESAVERTIENINTSRTLNFLFRQMNQEYAAVLHLVDVRVAFFSGHRESREEVPLAEMDSLLRRLLAEDQITPVRQKILGLIAATRDLAGDTHPGFVRTGTPDGTDLAPAVNPTYSSDYTAPDGRTITLPGIITAAEHHVMRTDGITVDAFLGEGQGLDAYSTGLQEQALRSQAADNLLKEREAERLQIALEIARDGDTRRAEAFRTLFMPTQIVNQIDHAAVSSGLRTNNAGEKN